MCKKLHTPFYIKGSCHIRSGHAVEIEVGPVALEPGLENIDDTQLI